MTVEMGKQNSLDDTTVLGSFPPLSTLVSTMAGNAPSKSSHANITSKPSLKKVDVHTLFTHGGNGIDMVVPVDSIRAISERFDTTTYGFFLGKKVAYPVVANYVRNTWDKYGLVRSMFSSSTGLFSFQFNSMDGLDAMLENGPWFIWNNPLILKKWHPDENLLKEDVSTPLMLDSYTSDMCMQSWGRSSYARVMIELKADVELKDNIVVAMPKITREGHYTCNVCVEYEWKPPRCSSCKVFGHVHEECTKNTGVGEKKTMNKPSQTSRGKLRLLDNDENPLVHTGIVESDSEVELVFDETANLRIPTSGKDRSDKSYGTNSLLEQLRDSYPDNDNYDPYDDDMYKNHDLSEHLQSIVMILISRYVLKLRRNLISLGTLEKEGFTVKIQSGKIKVIKGSLMALSGTIRANCVYTLDGHAMTRKTLKGGKQLGEYQTVWSVQGSLGRGYNHVYISSEQGTGLVQMLQGVEFEVEPKEDHTFEVEPHGNVDHVVEDSNEAAFAVAAVDKIYAHESLTFNNTVACEVISKWKDGLKDDMDAPSDVYMLSNGYDMVFSCGCKAEIWATKGFLDKAKGNVFGMEIVRDQNGSTLRVSQSRFYNGKLIQTLLEGHSILSLEGSLSGDCDVEKNSKWSCIYAVGSQEYQMVYTRLDIASLDVGMLDKFDRGIQIDIQVFVDFDYTMRRSITVMAGYITLTVAANKAIWLKGFVIELGFELKIVAGIATGALPKAIPGPRFQHRLDLLSIGIG
ncbi:zinc finger, CCHC-type containing protein [Tanacetum coccineum]